MTRTCSNCAKIEQEANKREAKVQDLALQKLNEHKQVNLEQNEKKSQEIDSLRRQLTEAIKLSEE